MACGLRCPRNFYADKCLLFALDAIIHRLIVYKGRGQMSQNEVRKRREEAQVEIRRQKREENLAKRRNLYPSDGTGADSDDEGAAEWESQVRVSPQSRRGLIFPHRMLTNPQILLYLMHFREMLYVNKSLLAILSSRLKPQPEFAACSPEKITPRSSRLFARGWSPILSHFCNLQIRSCRCVSMSHFFGLSLKWFLSLV